MTLPLPVWTALICMPALQDQLRCLAVKQGPLLVGTQFWAKQALTSVLSNLQAASMRVLLHSPNSNSDKPEIGALMVVCHTCHRPCPFDCFGKGVCAEQSAGIVLAIEGTCRSKQYETTCTSIVSMCICFHVKVAY